MDLTIEWTRKDTIDGISAASTPHLPRRAGGHRPSSDLMDVGGKANNVADPAEMPGRVVVVRTVWGGYANLDPGARASSACPGRARPQKSRPQTSSTAVSTVTSPMAKPSAGRPTSATARGARTDSLRTDQAICRCLRSRPPGRTPGSPRGRPFLFPVARHGNDDRGPGNRYIHRRPQLDHREPGPDQAHVDHPRAVPGGLEIDPDPLRLQRSLSSDHGIERGPTTDALRPCRPPVVEDDRYRYKGDLARDIPDNDRWHGMPSHGVDIPSTGSTEHRPCRAGSARASDRALLSSSARVRPRSRVRRDRVFLPGASRAGGHRHGGRGGSDRRRHDQRGDAPPSCRRRRSTASSTRNRATPPLRADRARPNPHPGAPSREVASAVAGPSAVAAPRGPGRHETSTDDVRWTRSAAR